MILKIYFKLSSKQGKKSCKLFQKTYNKDDCFFYLTIETIFLKKNVDKTLSRKP